jgi:thiol-disulfide isomerase/thioredoxin
MSRNTGTLLAAMGMVAVIGVIGLTSRAANGPESLEGKAAPAIALKTLEGQAVSLAEMKGKVVLVDMWATWCPPCRVSLPHVQKLATDKALAEKGLVVWGVNAREDKATIGGFMEENKYTFTVPMDEKGAVSKAYRVSGIPTTVVVGRDGLVKATFVGYAGEETAKEIDEAVNKALAEAAPK